MFLYLYLRFRMRFITSGHLPSTNNKSTNLKKLFISSLLFCSSLTAEPLRFSYWTEATEPFVFFEDEVLSGGIIKDIGDNLGRALNRDVTYLELPTPRIEPFLQSGKLDIDCVTSPIWKEKPETYHWSPVLFDGADRFLIRVGAENSISNFEDLTGRTLGIYNGYVYNPEIMQLIESGDIATVKVRDLSHAIKLLELKRIDAIIDFGVILKYQLKNKTLSEHLVLAKLPADEFQLHCAYSKKLNIENKILQEAFAKLIESGVLQKLLSQYR